MRSIGFVGLGMMGLPMVENLANAPGLEVLAFDQNLQQTRQLSTHAAWGKSLHGVDSLASLANCDAVITMLPNSPITNAVIGGQADQPGLLQCLRSGALVIDMGSSNPADTIALAARLKEASLDFVDAPVSGSVAKARTGTLAIMAGGSEAAVERARPLFEHMGSQIVCTGAIGSAHSMKTLNNYVYAAGLLAASEAMLIASRMGLDLEVLTDVLNASSGRNVATETKLRQFILSRTFNGGFALRLQAKDLATAHALQGLAGVEMPQLTLCQDVWRQAQQVLEAGADNTAIYRFLEQRADSSSVG